MFYFIINTLKNKLINGHISNKIKVNKTLSKDKHCVHVIYNAKLVRHHKNVNIKKHIDRTFNALFIVWVARSTKENWLVSFVSPASEPWIRKGFTL